MQKVFNVQHAGEKADKIKGGRVRKCVLHLSRGVRASGQKTRPEECHRLLRLGGIHPVAQFVKCLFFSSLVKTVFFQFIEEFTVFTEWNLH